MRGTSRNSYPAPEVSAGAAAAARATVTPAPTTVPAASSADVAHARLLVVDDEWAVGEGIAAALRDGGYDVSAVCATAAAALVALDAGACAGRPVDGVVCDVYLGAGPTGLALCDELERRGLPYVLVTGQDYRDVLGELGALRPGGIVLKPVNGRDLLSQVGLALRTATPPATLSVRHRGRRHALPLRAIRYLETADGDCVIHARGGRRYLHAETLTGTLTGLPPGTFARVHRRYAVNLRHVEGLRYGELALAGGARLPVGRRYYADLKEALRC